ncbi:MAG: 1-deoxy-D-xylulose-5-phosphate synthase [Oscillospiraceae bacterium]|nr:1-deoxy-D-xylulose-5-phosphate synthase [Oscillospiraceae bacterium]
MSDFKLLGNIYSPDDLKKLNGNDLPALAQEIRDYLIETVSENGGHLSSNLGVVELSIALHRVFESPRDKIVWDVGHQIYTHKIITGRKDEFPTLRKVNGISGFCAPNESEHDTFFSGHSSTSISSALGIAAANKISGNDAYTVAIIGDGALTGGMAYEALNNAGRSKTRLIVILNDNEMSISPNVGSMARYLAVIRSKPEYFRLKARTEDAINRIPVVGNRLAKNIFNLKTQIKNRMYKSTFFEELGFRYMGPIDGHNIEQLSEALYTAKLINAPVLLHINTVKGKGYDFAEKSPDAFHGISKFNIDSGEPHIGGKDFSSCFGKKLCELAENDSKICAVTAAMSLGTGLNEFSQKFSNRFFDVGIAEEHAVTFASGLAKGGMIPVVAVYSTFIQRAYDQLVHDGTLQKQKLIVALDRAGFVGEDGVTHQGLLDVSFLNSIPDITVYSPYTFANLRSFFEKVVNSAENLTVIRYPRGCEATLPDGFNASDRDYDVFGNGKKALIVTYGRITANAISALTALRADGIDISVLSLNKIKPISLSAVKTAAEFENIFFYEESVKSGGIGQSFADMLYGLGFCGKYRHIAVPDEFVAHAPVDSLMKKYGFDCDSIVKMISENTNG